MKLFLLKPRGFCVGVVRAIKTVEKALSLFGAPIYVKHEIVHNKHVVDSLKKDGAVFVENLDEVPIGGKIVYSAHGVSLAVRKEARAKDLLEIDATCPLVMRLHSAVKHYANRGYKIILIGHKEHAETIGTAGEAPEDTFVVESAQDIEKLCFSPEQKIFYLMQTTLNLDHVKDIVEVLLKKFPQAKTLSGSSICYATRNRQLALKNIIVEADLVFVVGDSRSSNSNRLKEVALKGNKAAYLINDEDEIQKEYLQNVKTIAMTAGASTPENVVQRCIKKLIEYGVNQVEERIFKEEEVVFQLPKEVL